MVRLMSYSMKEIGRKWGIRESEELVKSSSEIASQLRKGRLDPRKVYSNWESKEPYGDYVSLAPLPFFAPFYRCMIVRIYPFRRKADFRRHYGADLDEVIRLVKDDFVIPFCESPIFYPEWYKELFLEIEIKENIHIPGIQRLYFILETLSGLRESIYDRINERFGKQEPNPAWQRILLRLHKRPRKAWLEAIAATLIDLKILGLNNLAEGILELDDVNEALWASNLSGLLINPLFGSLNGYTNDSRFLVDEANNFFRQYGLEEKPNRLLLPCRTMLVELSKELGYGYPERHPPIEFLEKIREMDEIEENLKALIAIQNHVEKIDVESAYEEAQKVREVIRKIEDEAKTRVPRNYKFVKYGLNIGFVTLLPAAASWLSHNLAGIAPYVSFPLYEITSIGVALSDQAKRHLEELAKWLTGCLYRKNVAPYILWKRKTRK